jgi:hypothetical protein
MREVLVSITHVFLFAAKVLIIYTEAGIID